MSGKRLLVVLGSVVAAVLVVLGGAAWIASSGFGGGEEPRVEVVDGGNVVRTTAARDALRAVSDEVGFEARLPAELPGGFRLKAVSGVEDPPGVPQVLAHIAAVYENQHAFVIVVDHTDQPFGAPTDRAERVDIGVDGAEGYRQRSDAGTGYWLLTADRGYLLTVQHGTGEPSDELMTKILKELAR